jgi:hypothetical protein
MIYIWPLRTGHSICFIPDPISITIVMQIGRRSISKLIVFFSFVLFCFLLLLLFYNDDDPFPDLSLKLLPDDIRFRFTKKKIRVLIFFKFVRKQIQQKMKREEFFIRYAKTYLVPKQSKLQFRKKRLHYNLIFFCNKLFISCIIQT